MNWSGNPLHLFDGSLAMNVFRHAPTEPVIVRDGVLRPLHVPAINGQRSGWAAVVSRDSQKIFGAVAVGRHTVPYFENAPPLDVFTFEACYWTLDGQWYSLNTGPGTAVVGCSSNGARVVVASGRAEEGGPIYPPEAGANYGVILDGTTITPFGKQYALVRMGIIDRDGNLPNIMQNTRSEFDRAVSPDGQWLFGESWPLRYAFRRSTAGGPLTALPLNYTGLVCRYRDMNTDGSLHLMVERGVTTADAVHYFWSPNGGRVNASTYFAARGIQLWHWLDYGCLGDCYDIYAMSDDARFFVGSRTTGTRDSFVIDLCANLPCGRAPCPADLTLDTFVDDADFSIFAVSYDLLVCSDPAMPTGCPADLNADGTVDDADFSIFVVAYDALLCP